MISNVSLLAFAGYIASFLGASIAIFLVFARVLQAERDSAARLFVYSLGFGPIAIAWTLSKFLYFLPGRSDGFYLACVSATFVLAAFAGRRSAPLLVFVLDAARVSMRAWCTTGIVHKYASLLVVGLVSAMFLLVWLTPLTENDPLEYATVAREVYLVRDSSIYPLVDTATASGFYGPWTHPIGYVSLIVWVDMLQGNVVMPGLMRLIAPTMSMFSAVLLWYLAGRRMAPAGPVAALLLVSAPLYFAMGAQSHIDPLYVHAWLLALAWLGEIVAAPSPRNVIVAGIITGSALFCHSLSFLLLAMTVPVYLVLAREPARRRLASIVLLVLVAVALVLPAYVDNLRLYGSVISDNPDVFRVEGFNYKEYLRYERGLFGHTERVLFGVFGGWTLPNFYGAAYWLLLFSLLTRRWSLPGDGDRIALVFWCTIGFYFAMMAVSVALGLDAFIVNKRYLLALQPLVSYIGALALVSAVPELLKLSLVRSKPERGNRR